MPRFLLLILTLAFLAPAPARAIEECTLGWRSFGTFGDVDLGTLREALKKLILRQVTGQVDGAALNRFTGSLGAEDLAILLRQVERTPLPLTAENFPHFVKAARSAAFLGEGERLPYYFTVFTHPEVFARYSQDRIYDAFRRVDQARDPYNTAAHLGSGDPVRRVRQLIEFDTLVRARDVSLGSFVKRVSHWADSPDRALYVYEHLEELGPRAGPVFAYLCAMNEFFKNVGRVRGPPRTLVTYAFEKETRNPDVTLWYRDPRMTDDEWFALPKAERRERLDGLVGDRTKTFHSAGRIAPTRRKPPYFGGFSQESGMGRNILYEFAHRGFEIDPKRLVGEMRDVAGKLKETDAMHAHVVFELPEYYERMGDFAIWAKHLNDYLYLAGMEESLHWTDLSTIAEAAPPAHVRPSRERREIPNLMELVNTYDFKFFNAGIRAGPHYGRSNTRGFRKVAVELRDVSRDLDKWEGYIGAVGAAARARIWESRDAGDPRRAKEILLTLRTRLQDFELLKNLGLSDRNASDMLEADPTVLIPLRKFEEALYYDYGTKEYRSCPPETAARIIAARKAYVADLLGTQKGLDDNFARGEYTEPEDLKTAIRWSLTDWAKAARVSELYRGVSK